MNARCAAFLLGLALLGACGKEPSPESPPGARVRLWTLDTARLKSAPAPAPRDTRAAQPLLHEDFAAGIAAWRTVVDPGDPLRADAELLQAEVRNGTRSLLRLEGVRGGLYRVLTVEPETCYELRGLVRTEGLAPEAESGFFGGTFFVGELSRRGTPEEVFAQGFDAVVVQRHELAPGRGTSAGFVERRVAFRTRPETRSLVVVCVLALSHDLAGGACEFTDLDLRTVDEHVLWGDQILRASAERSAGVLPAAAEADAADWRNRRVLRASAGGEARPAVVLLPGESLELLLSVPAGEPVLEAGLAPFVQGLEGLNEAAARARTARLRVRVEGEELFATEERGVARALDARWRPLRVDLSAHAGKTAHLELASTGSMPLVLGAPVVRDAAGRLDGFNLLLVSIDTLRADHVSCYGYEKATTPELDALAARGLLALDCTAQAPYTLPSHVSLFSGQHPSVHGVQAAENRIGALRTPLLADLLAREGLLTQAFTAGGYVNPVFGFDRGFDGYATVDPYRDPGSRHIETLIAEDPEHFDRRLFEEYGPERVSSWLDAHADERWMLFLHTYTVHDFDPPPGWVEKFPSPIPPTLEDFMPFFDYRFALEHGIPEGDRLNLLRHYDAALASVDAELGRVFRRLEALGLTDKTVVVVTSDHGKEIGERGVVAHGVTLYEELTRVPLIVFVPGRAPRVLEQPTMLVDVAPTLLSVLGLERDVRMQGLDLFDPELPARAVWSEVVQPLAHRYALRDPAGWKVLHDPGEEEVLFPAERTWELYRLPPDPGERDELSAREPSALKRLQAALRAERGALEAAGAALGEAGSGALDASTREQLEVLGYFGHDGD